MPAWARATTPSIVEIVTSPKMPAIRATPARLLWALGYLVYMGMFAGVGMLVDVHITRGVDVQVGVGPLAVGTQGRPLRQAQGKS